MCGNGVRPETPRSRQGDQSRAALLIFAKAPIPGGVKTRLCPPLTPDEAASLHGTFVLDVLERSAVAAKRGRPKGQPAFDRILACAPSTEHVFFKVLEERHGVELLDQIGDDLGARMAHAVEAAFSRGYQSLVLVGTDVPTLPDSLYTDAFTRLSSHDLVLGPAEDGGYYLIGMTRPQPDLFRGLAWSTGTVLIQTHQKAESLGLRVTLLPRHRDIDTIDDLKALIAEGTSRLSTRTAGAVRLIGTRLSRR